MWELFFYRVGVYAVIWYLCRQLFSSLLVLLSYLKDYLLPMTKKSLVEKYGNWAVVTGSSDGMGKAYAREIALKGFNVVLIARNEEKLKAVKREIENEAKVQVKYIITDFSHGYEIYDRLEKELADIPVGVLVNNVGLSLDTLCTFELHPQKFVYDLILVNVAAAVMMTKIILKGMRKRGKGAIVNVSSICVYSPLTHKATPYFASKTFLSSFTRALQYELMNVKNIHVQLLEPCFVNTKMLDFSSEIQNFALTVTPEDWAKKSISLLGRSHHTHGCLRHSIVSALLQVFPEPMRIWTFNYLCTFFNMKEN